MPGTPSSISLLYFPCCLKRVQLSCWIPALWKKVIMQLFGYSCTEFSSAHHGSDTVLSVLLDLSACNPHVEVDSLRILTFQLGKLRFREVK